MATPRIPNNKKQYGKLNARLKGYLTRVKQLYDTYTTRAAHIASRANFDPSGDRMFKFSDYPQLKGAIEDLLNEYMSGVSANIMRGTSEEWKNCNEFQDLIVNKALKTYGVNTKSGEVREIYYQDNPDRLKAFQQRRDSGMNLSRRVWNLKEQYKQELELGLSVGIERGISANDLARNVKKYLNEPDKLFRRVRDKYGRLQLSKAAKAYHPGRGVYRSSFKNAQRLTRSEINMSYRTAEQVRWQQFDFVLGYEIKLSKSHPCEDVCDKLAGKYPKTFKWTGWHPNDLCYCIPILKSEEEFFSLDTSPSPNEITDVPEAFKEWVRDNKDRISAANERGTTPYFIRDNKDYIDDILKPREAKKTALQIAAERHAARTQEDIYRIREKWSHRKINQLWDAINDGYLPPECANRIAELKDDITFGDFDEFNIKAKVLDSAIARHRNRTDLQIKTIREAWDYKDSIELNGKEIRIRTLIAQSKVIDTENGKVYLHPAHGKTEKAENIEFAKWRANAYGEKVILIPNPPRVKSADSYNITRRCFEEYKLNKTPTYNAIDRAIRDGSKQANNLIFDIKSDISIGDLRNAICDRVNRCSVEVIRIKFGDMEATYSRNQILKHDFKIKLEDFTYSKFLQSRGIQAIQQEIEPNANAKLIKLFESSKDISKISKEEQQILSILGIKRGNTQTLDQIRGKVNPNYDPKDPATSRNCSCCTYAAELRMRGYDVTAAHREYTRLKSLEDEYRVRHQIGYQPHRVKAPTTLRAQSSGEYGWIDPATGLPPVHSTIMLPKSQGYERVKELKAQGLSYIEASDAIAKENFNMKYKALLDAMPDNGRYDLMVTWKNGNSHSMMAIRDDSGLTVYCSQTECIKNIGAIFNNIDKSKGVRFLRMDTLEIDPIKIKELVRVNGRDLSKEDWEVAYQAQDFSELKKKLGKLWVSEEEMKLIKYREAKNNAKKKR